MRDWSNSKGTSNTYKLSKRRGAKCGHCEGMRKLVRRVVKWVGLRKCSSWKKMGKVNHENFKVHMRETNYHTRFSEQNRKSKSALPVPSLDMYWSIWSLGWDQTHFIMMIIKVINYLIIIIIECLGPRNSRNFRNLFSDFTFKGNSNISSSIRLSFSDR